MPNDSPARSYLRRYAAACDCAMDRVGAITQNLQLGCTQVRLRLAGAALVPYTKPMAHQINRRPDSNRPALRIDLWDAGSTGVLPPPFPHDRNLPAKGEIRSYEEAGVRIQFTSGVRRSDGAFAAMTIFDERARVVRYFVSTPDRIPWYERSAPLRTAMHWGLGRSDGLLVHAGAVGSGGRGILLAGRGGSGKSTTAVAALLAGYDYLGDDYVFLDLGGPHPVAHSLHGTAKLAPEALALLPGLGDPSACQLSAGADKHVLEVATLRPDGLCRSARIVAIVVPRIQPSGSAGLERLSPGAALLALAPTTVLQSPRPDAAELTALAELVRRVPAYQLSLTGSTDPIGPTIEQLANPEEPRWADTSN